MLESITVVSDFQTSPKKLSLVDSLEWELGNYVLKVDKLMQPTVIVLLFYVGLSGYEFIYRKK